MTALTRRRCASNGIICCSRLAPESNGAEIKTGGRVQLAEHEWIGIDGVSAGHWLSVLKSQQSRRAGLIEEMLLGTSPTRRFAV